MLAWNYISSLFLMLFFWAICHNIRRVDSANSNASYYREARVTVMIVRYRISSEVLEEQQLCAIDFSLVPRPTDRNSSRFLPAIPVFANNSEQSFCYESTMDHRLDEHPESILLVKYDPECSLSSQIRNVERNFKSSSGVIIFVPPNVKLLILVNATENPEFNVILSSDAIFPTDNETTEILLFNPIRLKPWYLNFTVLAIWFLAVFTVVLGSYWSGITRHAIYVENQTKLSSTTAEAAAPLTTETSKEEAHINLSSFWVVIYVGIMSAMLIALYFFFKYLVYVIIFIFVLTTMSSTYICLKTLVQLVGGDKLCLKKVSFSLCNTNHSPVIYQVLILIVSVTLPLVWFFTRKHSNAWILQDFLGIMLSLNIIRTFRLPNLKIATLLLCLLFVYDIFFVFITPLLTSGGKSIMVEVATGRNGDKSNEDKIRSYNDFQTSESYSKIGELPMVLAIPYFSSPGDTETDSCFRNIYSFSMLGFGDILVPGLLVAYVHAFDLIRNTPCRVYFLATSLGYTIGLPVTFFALHLMEGSAQPALLYLVPLTLLPVFLLGFIRKELRDLWIGPGDGHNRPLDVNQAEAASDNTEK